MTPGDHLRDQDPASGQNNEAQALTTGRGRRNTVDPRVRPAPSRRSGTGSEHDACHDQGQRTPGPGNEPAGPPGVLTRGTSTRAKDGNPRGPRTTREIRAGPPLAAASLRISHVRVVPLPEAEVRERQRELARVLLEMEEAYRLAEGAPRDPAA